MSAISTNDLYNYLPHKPPMVWVDEVLDFNESRGRTRITLKVQGLYMTNGVLRASSFIEFVAQSYAFVNLSHLRSGGDANASHSRTYLAAVKDFTYDTQKTWREGDRLTIHVQKTRNFGPISVVRGEVFSDANEKVASCELKLFSE